MKKFIVVMALLATATAVQAQDEGYIELLRSDIRTTKIAVITEVMQLEGEQSEAFWSVYKEYDHEMSKINDKRLAVIKDYAKNFENITDEKATELVNGSLAFLQARLDLQKKYFKEFQTALPAALAAKFIQLDRQIMLLIDLQIAANVPLIEPSMLSEKTE